MFFLAETVAMTDSVVAAILAMGVFFWIATVVVLLVCSILIISDNGIGAAVATVIYLGLIWWFSGIDVLGLVSDHWKSLLIGAPIYIIIGIAWSIYKWILYCRQALQRVIDYKVSEIANWRRNYPKKSESMSDAEVWVAVLEQARPIATQHNDDVCRWIFWWPFSILGYFFSDLLRDFGRFLVSSLSGIYDRISKWAFTPPNDL